MQLYFPLSIKDQPTSPTLIQQSDFSHIFFHSIISFLSPSSLFAFSSLWLKASVIHSFLLSPFSPFIYSPSPASLGSQSCLAVRLRLHLLATNPPNRVTNMTTELNEVDLVPNTNLQRDGLKAYGYLLSKYGFNPTKPGPFTTVTLVRPQAQLQSYGSDRVLGEKGRQRPQLQFKDQSGRVGKVPANSISNDLEWLCPVKIGTPAKTYHLNFDTGSADLWVSNPKINSLRL